MRQVYCFAPLMLLCFVCGCQKEAQPLTQVKNKEAALEITAQPKIAVVQAYGGPFGLQKGLTKEQLDAMGIKLSSSKEGLYTTDKLLKEHSEFQKFLLVVTENEGLCKIIAQSGIIETGDFGSTLQKKFIELEGQLQEVYGKHKRYDYLRSGSAWKEPQYWMMGLLKEDRTLAADWITEEGSTMKNNIRAIELQAQAVSSGAGTISIR